jgi:hypothetical protein
MQLVGMMLGGFVGLLLFDKHSWGFVASVFVGALIGMALQRQKPSPPPLPVDNAGIGPTSGTTAPTVSDFPALEKGPLPVSADVAATDPPPTAPSSALLGPAGTLNSAMSKGIPNNRRMPFRLLVGAIVLGAVGSLAWLTARNRAEEPRIHDVIPKRPDIHAEIWDQRHCLQSQFPQSRFMAVPPQIAMFCAHPWNGRTIRKLSEALDRAHIGFSDLISEHPQIAAMIELIPDNDLRNFILFESLLPLAKAEGAMSERMKSAFSPAVLEKIQVFKANVPWDDRPTDGGLTRYYLGSDITLVSDQFDINSVAELADAFFAYVTTGSVIGRAMGEKVANLVDAGGILASPESSMTLLFLQLDIFSETHLVAPPYETAWAKSPHDYEIYFTDALSDWPCDGQSVAGQRAALLCPEDRRLFVSVAPLQTIGDIYPELGGKTVFKLPPAFFHELAHMFRDPTNRQAEPFMAEARASAQGEQFLQTFKAAVSKANDPKSLQDMRQFFNGLGDPNYKGPNKGALLKVDQIVKDQPFTVFQTAAVCYVAYAPPDAQHLIRTLEMSATFFNSQAPMDLRHAYYTAWSLFQYGDDRPGFQYGGDRLDARIIIHAADLVARNQPIEGQDLIAINNYLRDAQQLARDDIERKHILCPTSGSAKD